MNDIHGLERVLVHTIGATMADRDWQLIVVLICVAAAFWSMVARFRNLIAGKGGCGDCSKANPATTDSNEPKLVSEDQIEMLYETRK